MWGQWFTLTTGAILILLLLVASAFLASPLLALLIAALGLVLIGAVYGLRRATTGVGAPGERPVGNAVTAPRSPRSGGAPVSGEGSRPSHGG